MSFMVSATAYSITMPSNQVTKVSGSYRADTPGKGRTPVQRGQRPLWGVGQDGFVFMVWGEKDRSLLCLNINGKPQVKVLGLDCRMSFVAPRDILLRQEFGQPKVKEG